MKEYNDYIDEIMKKLDTTLFGILATSNKEATISIAQMCIINNGLDVYFQTDKKFEKVSNILENNKVAINLGEYSFKGTAKILGHPTIEPIFIKKMKKKHPKTYESYTNLQDEVLIKVDLSECKIWHVDPSKPVKEQESIMIIDLINKRINTIICDKQK